MPKAKNAKADEALALYRQGLKLVDIAPTPGTDAKANVRKRKKRAFGSAAHSRGTITQKVAR